jgi:hypothetical protein
MNLGGMCRLAARYSDRYDEYIKTQRQDGTQAYEGEALHWFELFRDAINEAYFEVSRGRLMPTTRMQVKLAADRIIELCEAEPEVCTVCGVYRSDGVSAVGYVFRRRTRIEVIGAAAGEEVVVEYHYLPERLQNEEDEPVFAESAVDPTVYVSLAVARVWQSERKMNTAQQWLGEYYQKLRTIRTGMKPLRMRRLTRPLFR